VADAGLRGEVVHPRYDQQVARQAVRRANRVEQVQLRELTVGDQDDVGPGVRDDRVQVGDAAQAGDERAGDAVPAVVDVPEHRQAVVGVLAEQLRQFGGE